MARFGHVSSALNAEFLPLACSVDRWRLAVYVDGVKGFVHQELLVPDDEREREQFNGCRHRNVVAGR
ncbi:MAG: hypothetical protein JWN95_2415 [Frankiales bacterium]|nr:hypothetical protein [Frankiales bacterium]